MKKVILIVAIALVALASCTTTEREVIEVKELTTEDKVRSYIESFANISTDTVINNTLLIRATYQSSNSFYSESGDIKNRLDTILNLLPTKSVRNSLLESKGGFITYSHYEWETPQNKFIYELESNLEVTDSEYIFDVMVQIITK